MNNKIFTGCLFAASMLFTTSCSDFLTEDPKGKITPDSFYSNQNEVDMAVHSLYAMVQGFQCNSNPMIMQCQGDDVTSSNNKGAYLSSDAFEVPSDAKGLEDGWMRLYRIVYAANSIIDNVPGADISDENKNLAMGQAYYWRAFAYFSLVRLYGPIPMNLHNENDFNQATLMDVAGVYEQILTDLTAAEACNLPAQYTGTPQSINGQNQYVSQQAVKATMAAVYMSKAGYPLKDNTSYKKAAEKAWEVIQGVNNGTYKHSLLSDWADVYSFGNNHHDETILGIDYKTTPGGWSDGDSQFSSCHQFASVFGGWGDFLPERKFWTNFPEGPRKDAVYAKEILVKEPVYSNGQLQQSGVTVDWWATKDGEPYNGSNAVISEYRPMFISFTVNKDPISGSFVEDRYDFTAPFWAGMCIGKRHHLIRYSEVLLWYAESAARAGMDITEARKALKEVRSRAYSDVAKINEVDNMDASTLAEAAYSEHGYEVAGYTLSMVTRRSDEFRMERLKNHFDYRTGDQNVVIVPKGTQTKSMDAEGNAFTYTLKEDLIIREDKEITATWNGESSIYHNYPPKEVEKNPNLKR